MAQFSNQHMDRSFLEADIPEIVSKLKADERALLLSGVNWWNTLAIPRLNVPGVRMSDGPNVRPVSSAICMMIWLISCGAGCPRLVTLQGHTRAMSACMCCYLFPILILSNDSARHPWQPRSTRI